MPSIKFPYTGSLQNFTVPAGIYNIAIKVWGAGGGPPIGFNAFGGAGGYSYGELAVTPGQVLDIMVGQAGKVTSAVTTYGGGGAGGASTVYPGSSGGGRSGVAFSGGTQFIIAGGGGGGAAGSVYVNIGGNGGGTTGNDEYISNAAPYYSSLTAATGGTQTAGGTGGSFVGQPAAAGFAGSLYQGGTGGTEQPSPGGRSGAGGGGGGGYYGGGGGASAYMINASTPAPDEQSGGGGSGYLDTTILYNAITQSTPQPTSGPTILPPNTSDPDYIVGVGVASSATGKGTVGNGLVVIDLPDLKLTKTVDQSYTSVGSTLNYTVNVANLGPSSLNNIVFSDTVPTGTTFVNGSLSVNGTPFAGNPNPPGVTIPNTINAGESFTVTFSATVTATLPNPIKNQALSSYGNGLYPYISNQVTTTIASPVLVSTKSVNASVAKLGDTLTYTVTFKNTGNTAANNLVFTDTLPTGTTFVTNSVKVNGTALTGRNPNPPGFTITIPVSSIAAGGTITVTFTATVTSIPASGSIVNSADLAYTYTMATIANNDSGRTTTNSVTTNTLTSPTKTVDKANALVGDVLTYTLVLKNSLSTTESNVVLIDTIPTGTTFVPNSVTLNGLTQGGTVAPPSGLTIGTMAPNATATVTFQVTVATIPTVNPIPNSAVVSLTYAAPTTINTSLLSNIVTTTVADAIVSQVKTVNKTNAFAGDVLIYTIVLKNSGNTTANNVLFVDTVPSETSFVGNSLTVNGVTQTGLTPNLPGISIPSIGPNSVATIVFNATITTIPTTNPFANISSTGFDFVSNPTTGATTSKNSNSNQVTTFVNPNNNPLKIVSEVSGKVGDVLTYTISYLNNSNVTATSVTLFDTIPTGTAFVSNSIQVNGVTTPGTLTPPTGLTIPDIAPNARVTVTFNATVTTLPTINPLQNTLNMTYVDFGDTTLKSNLTNTVSTEINDAILSPATKSVDKAYATVGDTLTYTIAMTNIGNVTALNVLLTDTIPNGTSFVADSIYLNGVNVPGTTVAPSTGFNIGTIPVNGTATVTFKLLVTTIPTPNPIINNSTLNYNYIFITSTGQLASGSTNTNSTSTKVNFANIMYPTKTVDKAYTNVPATITYTIAMQNLGNTTALNLVFSDTIPTGTTFVANSVTLNGVTQSGAVVAPPGFTVGTLPAGAIATVTFQVNVSTIPTPNPILNSGTTTYSYIIDPSIPTIGTGSGNTNTASTKVEIADLSGVTKSVDKAYATCGDIVNYTIVVPNAGNATALNVILVDTIPNGTIFVNNSLYINSVQQVGSNPATGVIIPNIGPGATATLTFSVQIQCL